MAKKFYGQEPTIKNIENRLKWYITLQSVIMIVWYHEKKTTIGNELVASLFK